MKWFCLVSAFFMMGFGLLIACLIPDDTPWAAVRGWWAGTLAMMAAYGILTLAVRLSEEQS